MNTTETSVVGQYSFEDVPMGEYTISADADGYVASGDRELSVTSAETQQDITLEPTASLSVLFVEEGNSDTEVDDAPVRLINMETGNEVHNSSTGSNGRYENASVPAGEYVLELFNRDGYTDESVEIELTPGESYEDEVSVTSTPQLNTYHPRLTEYHR
jgi:hypothetical protein